MNNQHKTHFIVRYKSRGKVRAAIFKPASGWRGGMWRNGWAVIGTPKRKSLGRTVLAWAPTKERAQTIATARLERDVALPGKKGPFFARIDVKKAEKHEPTRDKKERLALEARKAKKVADRKRAAARVKSERSRTSRKRRAAKKKKPAPLLGFLRGF